MDSWTDKQIQMMRAGGNDKCIKFLAQYNVAKNTPIIQKYNTPAAMLYKER
jgi:ADP-ribosylation factor GTPase-activating protein 1